MGRGVRCTRRGLTKKIYAFVYIFRKAPSLVYKIPYRRARAWPLGRVRRASKGILHTTPSRTWRVREGALRKIYAYVYIFRKAPSRTWRVREGALRKIYAYVYIFRKAPSRTWRVREGALRKYMLTYIFFVRPLLEHGVYEKVPYKKYMLTYIFFVRPLLEHGGYEKVPCAHACARFLLHVIFNAWHYHRFESFRQITVELHKKNSVERDKAFLFLEISFELSSQLEDHQDACMQDTFARATHSA